VHNGIAPFEAGPKIRLIQHVHNAAIVPGNTAAG
jgi:hypothetical protein